MARSNPDTIDERTDSSETLHDITGGECTPVTEKYEGEN